MQPNLLSIRKKFLLSGVSSEYKDLAKFAEDTDPHLIVEELEEFLESLKEDFIVFRNSILRQTTGILQLSENCIKFKKTTGQPKYPWLATRTLHSAIPQVHGQN